MLAKQIRQYIIKPALQEIDLWSDAAELLIYGTGWIESGYDALAQIGSPKNGGLGFFQDEPSDYKDLCIWLRNGFNKGMMGKVLAATYYAALPLDPTILMSNVKLAVLCCRIHYHRVKPPIPLTTDAKAMAEYHAKFYNSGGKTDVDKNTITFQRIINNEI